ncbi:MAG: class I SAM-dependent methyltransferase [Theionarchaea archaeon]|nr:class I SAM-dependent methyltransferase [Theionarchaea archaeon]
MHKKSDSQIDETVEYYRLSYLKEGDIWQDNDEFDSGPASDFFINSLPKNSLVLEQGCGTGHGFVLRGALAGHSVEGFDISLKAIEICATRLTEKKVDPSLFNLWVQDIRDFVYSAEHYNGIVDFYTLQHFPKPLQKDIIKKVYNSLKPQGLFLFGLHTTDKFSESDPKISIAENGRVTLHHSETEVRHFYPWDVHPLESFLESVGFRIVLTYRGTENGFCEIVCQKPGKVKDVGTVG